MALPLKAIPSDDRPRERLLRLGPEQLTDAELVAILLGTGRKGCSVIQLAGELLHHCEKRAPGDALQYLLKLRAGELQKLVPGIGPAKLCQILAALQIGLRTAGRPRPRSVDLSNPRAVYEYLSPRMSHLDREQFWAIFVTAKNHVIDDEVICEGTLTCCHVYAREIFKSAIRRSAHAVILAHNHPSGDPSPSREDRELTLRLIQAGRLLGVEVLDHLIIGTGQYVSFREQRVVEWS